MSDVVLGRSHLDRLIEAMLAVPAMSDPDERDAHVDDLIRTLRRPVEVARSVDVRQDLTSIVRACLTYSGALSVFTREVSRRHPGDAAARAAALADEIAGAGTLLSAPDREALRRSLVGIPMEQLVGAIGELSDVPELGSVQVWRDMAAVIRVTERQPPLADGVPPLLAFIDRLAHLVAEERAEELHRWIDMVGGGLGVTPAAAAALHPLSRAQAAEDPAAPGRAEETGRIWGDVPIRNRSFTGRGTLLDRLKAALQTSSKASVLPQTLHGMGGVGKTQLVIEYVHRHAREYDLVWWIAAEQTATVLSSLAELAARLGLQTTEDRQQTARTVLNALAGGSLTWLLVYDNADDPDTLDQFVPSSGGHVILTTRNQEWATVGPAIEVDVFERKESIELLRKRSRDREDSPPRIGTAEADELAEKLGDLPLALEQAVAWHLATGMPIKEYIGLLDDHITDLLSEGKPAGYPFSVAAFVTLAVERLRESAPATAQLFELFAYLGGEPVLVSLLRFGKDAEISEPLRETLAASIRTNRIARDLNKLGLAKLGAGQRLQVHRLVQRVLRDTMPADRAAETQRNVRNLLASANPGDPDEQGEHVRQREMGPHIEPADMINAENLKARQAVLDHSRFLYLDGDYENSRLLAGKAVAAWEQDTWHPRLGPDGELTLLARAQVANATRTLGDSAVAAALAMDTYERFQRSPLLGPGHEFTLITGNQVGADLRIAGRYREALDFELQSVALHRDVFGPADTYTLRAQTNLAVDHRMIGNFAEALAIDTDIVHHWEDVGGTDQRELEARINVARDYYGMGAYRAGLEELERWRPLLHETLGARNRLVLLAGRTYAITLRKAGRLADALEAILENLELTQSRFGPHHEFTIAAVMSHANALRQFGELDEAMALLNRALQRYSTDFGARHPLTLIAQVNQAIVLRARNETAEARALDEHCYRELIDGLGAEHPYTLCAGSALATDLALAGEYDEAVRLSTAILEESRHTSRSGHEAREGAEHPYVLMRAINLSHDLRATGDTLQAEALLQESLSGLRRALSPKHPEVVAAERGVRTEGDIEPPPT